MDKKESLLRRMLKICLRAFLALIAIVVVFGIYADFKVKKAEKQVRAFSELVVVGMPVVGPVGKANEMGLKFRRTAGSSDQSGSIQVWGGFAFGRWFCDVDYVDGKATEKRVTSLD